MLYRYKALDSEGVKQSGYIEGSDERELWKELRLKELYPISIKKKENRILREKRVSYKDISELSNEIGSMLGAGVNLANIVKLLSKENSNETLNSSLREIHREILQGNSISRSFSKFPKIYPSFFISMVEIAEESGSLEEVFNKLNIYYKKMYDMEKKIKEALSYPSFVGVTAILIIVVVLNISLPMVLKTLKDFGGEIPKSLSLIMGLKEFVSKHCITIGFIFIILIFLAKNFIIPKIKHKKYKIILKIPLVNKLFLEFKLYEFTNTMEILVSSGVSLLSAINFYKNSTQNSYIKESLEKIITPIESGESLSENFRKLDFFKEKHIFIIKVGEEIGEMEEALKNLSIRSEEHLKTLLGKLLSLIQPVSIIVLSLIVVYIVALVMLPMVEVLNVV